MRIRRWPDGHRGRHRSSTELGTTSPHARGAAKSAQWLVLARTCPIRRWPASPTRSVLPYAHRQNRTPIAEIWAACPRHRGRTAVTNSQRWDHVGDPRVRPRGAAFWLGPHGLAGAAWSCHGRRRDRGYPTRCSVRCRVNRPVTIRSGPSRRRASYLVRFRAFSSAQGRSWRWVGRSRGHADAGFLRPGHPGWQTIMSGQSSRSARPGDGSGGGPTCPARDSGARSRTLGVTRSARAGDGQEPWLREPVHGRQQAPSGA